MKTNKNIKVKGHVGQGQRSNKDPGERQVGSQQHQVASLKIGAVHQDLLTSIF